jgi:hypothetical protein
MKKYTITSFKLAVYWKKIDLWHCSYDDNKCGLKTIIPMYINQNPKS